MLYTLLPYSTVNDTAVRYPQLHDVSKDIRLHPGTCRLFHHTLIKIVKRCLRLSTFPYSLESRL